MLDEVDRGLIHALQLDGRASFSRIAEVLGVSTQTVARRYQRLRAEHGMRVVGLFEPHRAGQTRWLARLTASPNTAQDLALALAKRADTSWVKLASGGTEIVTIVDTAAASGNPLLLHDIPRATSITSVSAHYILHAYRGGPTPWPGHLKGLTEEQQQRLTVEVVSGDRLLVESDRDLLAALGRDGRAGLADLAVATGWASATVARRLATLQSTGELYFDVEINPALLGATTEALLWMAVTPAHLDVVGTTLAQHDELAFVAATTGPTNLMAHALCADPGALHHYLTHRLGALDAIRTLETAPVLRTLKAAGPLPF